MTKNVLIDQLFSFMLLYELRYHMHILLETK